MNTNLAPGRDSKISNEGQKLRSLRSKTDQDLLILLEKEIDRALTLLEIATVKASLRKAQAEKIYLVARRVLPTLEGVDRAERMWIEMKMQELRRRLDIAHFFVVEVMSAAMAS